MLEVTKNATTMLTQEKDGTDQEIFTRLRKVRGRGKLNSLNLK